ncbi:hypothetical protein ACFL59_01295 [Planctomycetota bacterium]
MDKRLFAKALMHPYPEPSIDQLKRRYRHALVATEGNTSLALATVNELLLAPISNEDFLRIADGGGDAAE